MPLLTYQYDRSSRTLALTCFFGGRALGSKLENFIAPFCLYRVMKRAVAETGIVVLINAWADQCIRIRNFPFETFLSPFLIDLSSPFFHLETDIYIFLCASHAQFD